MLMTHSGDYLIFIHVRKHNILNCVTAFFNYLNLVNAMNYYVSIIVIKNKGKIDLMTFMYLIMFVKIYKQNQSKELFVTKNIAYRQE